MKRVQTFSHNPPEPIVERQNHDHAGGGATYDQWTGV